MKYAEIFIVIEDIVNIKYASPSATAGLYNISSTEGLTIGFDGHFSPLKELPGLKFQIVSKPVPNR